MCCAVCVCCRNVPRAFGTTPPHRRPLRLTGPPTPPVAMRMRAAAADGVAPPPCPPHHHPKTNTRSRNTTGTAHEQNRTQGAGTLAHRPTCCDSPTQCCLCHCVTSPVLECWSSMFPPTASSSGPAPDRAPSAAASLPLPPFPQSESRSRRSRSPHRSDHSRRRRHRRSRSRNRSGSRGRSKSRDRSSSRRRRSDRRSRSRSRSRARDQSPPRAAPAAWNSAGASPGLLSDNSRWHSPSGARGPGDAHGRGGAFGFGIGSALPSFPSSPFEMHAAGGVGFPSLLVDVEHGVAREMRVPLGRLIERQFVIHNEGQPAPTPNELFRPADGDNRDHQLRRFKEEVRAHNRGGKGRQ